MQRVCPATKSSYRYLVRLPTRWADNDAYGHVNNVAYYSFFDTVINRHLIESNVLDVAESSSIGLVVESRCSYLSSVRFPDELEVGLKVLKLGNSSVQYEIGVFKTSDDLASAVGHFTHVYVDRETSRPVTIPPAVRQVLIPLAAETAPTHPTEEKQ